MGKRSRIVVVVVRVAAALFAMRKLATTLATLALIACDKDPAPPVAQSAPSALSPSSGEAPPAAPATTPEAPQAPEIIIESTRVAVGKERVSSGDPALAERVASLVRGAPAIAGRVVEVVAMRNSTPSHVLAVVDGLRQAQAAGAGIKSSARDGTTQRIAVSFGTEGVADCTVVARIAKNATIEVWPAGGGNTKRVARGLAGPDMTLGIAALRPRWEACGSPVLAVGADDAMTWGLVFDLASLAVESARGRLTAVVLAKGLLPGRRAVLR